MLQIPSARDGGPFQTDDSGGTSSTEGSKSDKKIPAGGPTTQGSESDKKTPAS